jgi:hypothetical protein
MCDQEVRSEIKMNLPNEFKSFKLVNFDIVAPKRLKLKYWLFFLWGADVWVKKVPLLKLTVLICIIISLVL